MKNRWLAYSFLTLALSPLALADVSSTLRNVGNTILSIGNLNFLGIGGNSALLGFTRILLWIAIFTTFFAILTSFAAGSGGKKGALGFFNRTQAIVVSMVIATIAAVFLPGSILLATGTGWAVVVAFVLIGLPVFGIGWLLWHIPFTGPDNKWTVCVKIVLCLLLLWILSVMKYYVPRMI